MMIAKLIESGQDQLVLLPDEYRFAGDEVAISKIGQAVILLSRNGKWLNFLSASELFSPDFLQDGREQPSMQERESF